MDQMTLVNIAVISAWALGGIVSLLITYWVIRLAVTHGLRSHHYWLQNNS